LQIATERLRQAAIGLVRRETEGYPTKVGKKNGIRKEIKGAESSIRMSLVRGWLNKDV